LDIGTGQFLGFLFLLGIMMVAAPGVPGGAIMAAVGVLGDQLGFDQDQIAIMIAAYIAIDSFGTAANVTGDGAIALVVNKISGGALGGVDSAEARADEAIAEDISESRN
ncbi:MAG TPA: sodium:proton antiporter, partial [Corynebacterium nuruki]|nr:sodium:proton antiporter [Corynebacterium nuruki]